MVKSSIYFIFHEKKEKKNDFILRLSFYKMNMIGNRETDAWYVCVIGTVWLRLTVGPPGVSD